MKEKFEQISRVATAQQEAMLPSIEQIVEQLHTEALEGESYEDAKDALGKVDDLISFRVKVSKLPFGSFSEMIEAVTNINKLPIPSEKKTEQIKKVVEKLEERTAQFSPRVSDLFSAILSEIKNEPYKPKFKETGKKIDELRNEADFDVLFSSDISWEMKANRIEKRFADYLAGMRSLDERENKTMDDDTRKWRAGELKKAPTKPPSRRNESKPGVDPMDRLKEGEKSPSIWSIYPAWGGYYKEQSFSQWNSVRNVWIEEKYMYSDVTSIPLSKNIDYTKGPIDLTLTATVYTGEWISLPIPYTHGFHSVEAGKQKCSAQKDQNGDLVIFVDGESGGMADVTIKLAPYPDKRFVSREQPKAPNMPSKFTSETDAKLDEIKNKKRGNIARARAICSYVRSRIQYLAPKDYTESNQYNSLYNTHPNGFAGAVDEVKKGDCDVVNTYFAALCSQLNIPVRHCVGHSVKGKDDRGASNINSGTGHGWSEVWNEIKKEWVRMDATPAGDPNLEEEKKEKGGDSSAAPGDYGDQEAVRPSDEQLDALRKKLAERTTQLSYTREERYLAESAGVELKEARQIVKEINEAEKTRLPNGELVVDILTKLFNALVEARKAVAPTYDGPVRKREGGETIEDIVRHKIGILAGDTDPLSREKPSEEIQEEKIIGGFDLYSIGDKSGSMSSVDEESGERLWQMQRRAEYLMFSALHRFERNIERAGLQKKNALSVRTEGISFRGDNIEKDIDVDKPLSPEFNAKDKVKMWHSLTVQGSGNGDAEALAYVYGQIKKEIEENEKRGIKNNRLRLVIACSDGGYCGNDDVKMKALAEELGKLNAVVVGIGLTETAATVPIVMNTEYSRGDIVRTINDLPIVVAKHIVLEAIKLFPNKAQESAKQIIENIIAQFGNKE
ncbi:MAG: hypothetical protein HYW78_02805 [Parcubacteria group bacterium]|nr:hypothetical protein [Parcubacteria group bacterium]